MEIRDIGRERTDIEWIALWSRSARCLEKVSEEFTYHDYGKLRDCIFKVRLVEPDRKRERRAKDEGGVVGEDGNGRVMNEAGALL